jgi:hypothetical protein
MILIYNLRLDFSYLLPAAAQRQKREVEIEHKGLLYRTASGFMREADPDEAE